MKGLKALFYTLVSVLYLLMLLNGIYLALPIEIQEQVNFMTPITAVISGTAFGGVATAIMYLDKRFSNKEIAQEKGQQELMSSFIDYVAKNKDDLVAVIKGQKKIIEVTERNNRLLEADLNAKLNNELIDEKAKKIIEGVLNER